MPAEHKRNHTSDARPREGGRRETLREAQDRSRDDRTTQGQARSPVDSMHVDAPKKQDNARGHKRVPRREE